MTHGSLFSGIGGFDLAAEWMGWENKFHCEINEFCKKVLNHYWPNATTYGDIKTTDFSVWRGKIDVLSGGFPCQPFSIAGKRKGTSDDRYLWPEMLGAIREIKPRFVVCENVYGLLNWSRGLVFDQVQFDLEAEGYEIFPPLVLPACGKDAPHQRYRVWIIAHASGQFINLSAEQRGQREASNIDACGNAESRIIADSYSQRFSKRVQSRERKDERKNESYQGSESSRIPAKGNWEQFPTVSPVFVRNDGLSNRLDGITIRKWRRESMIGAGNAIVPHVAYEIFKAIEKVTSFL